MTEVAVLVPVLNRPQNVAPFLKSVRDTTPEARVVFICDPGDAAEQDAIDQQGAAWFGVNAGYARKINAGIKRTAEPLIFTAADDLAFRPGWLENAKAHMVDGVQVVGVNDLIRRRHRPRHATHFLMTRSYAERPTIDGARGPFSQTYDHSFCDDELIATATRRAVYTYADDAVVEHRHWLNGKAVDDDIYRKGRANFHRDKRRFERRSALWT